MKNSGFHANLPIGSPSSVSTTMASNTTNRPISRQQDAQHEREVAGAHAGASPIAVVGGAPRERDADAMNISPDQKSFWLLIFMLSPERNGTAGF